MSSTVIWRPEPLTAKLAARAVPARLDWAKAAKLRARSSRVRASIRVIGTTVAALHPLGLILEEGTRPHTIEPRKRVLKLADGTFVSGPVTHPGQAAQPFLKPTLPLWAPLYRRQAVGAFRGF